MDSKIGSLVGEKIVGISGNQYKLSRVFATGGQGVLYEECSGKFLVKIYHNLQNDSYRDAAIERIMFIKQIVLPRNFIRIEDVISEEYIGYVMEKITEYKSLNSYLIPNSKLSLADWYNSGRGLFDRLFIGLLIAKSFRELEVNNLAYCDISGNNILVKADKKYKVKMIDVDNVYTAGKGSPSVLGTHRYVAPEIIRKLRNPDVLSDNYSLAVILYELLRVGHPYISDEIIDGTPEDEDFALTGQTEYVTTKNSQHMLPEEVVFTDKLKKLFARCFIEGKSNRLCRPSAYEFEKALIEASNKVIECKNCKAWYYLHKKNSNDFIDCPWCDSKTESFAFLNFYDVLVKGELDQNYCVNKDKDKLILRNTYFLKRNNKNIIKQFYVLESLDYPQDTSEWTNYVSIADENNQYFLYNEEQIKGIILRKHDGRCISIDDTKPVKLDNGDEIFFEVGSTYNNSITCDNQEYKMIRMAKFGEKK